MDDYLLFAISTLIELSIPIACSILLSIIVGWAVARFSIGRKRTTRTIMFCMMFATYGCVLGFFIGASSVSIVKDAFATVVTVAATYFAFALSKDMHARVKAMIPAAIICFLLSLMFASTFFVKMNKAFAMNN